MLAIVYLIRNTLNGMVYIGQTKRTLQSRWYQHVWHAKSGEDTYFYRAMRLYGANAFKREILCIGPQAIIAELERFCIFMFQSRDHRFGYNCTSGGDGTQDLSPECRAKLSLRLRGRAVPWIWKCAAARKGAKFSEETKGKMRIAQQARWREHGVSKETRVKLSASKIGNKARLGKRHSDETKQKISLAALGKPKSQEAKQRMSLAAINRWATQRAKTMEATCNG